MNIKCFLRNTCLFCSAAMLGKGCQDKYRPLALARGRFLADASFVCACSALPHYCPSEGAPGVRGDRKQGLVLTFKFGGTKPGKKNKTRWVSSVTPLEFSLLGQFYIKLSFFCSLKYSAVFHCQFPLR